MLKSATLAVRRFQHCCNSQVGLLPITRSISKYDAETAESWIGYSHLAVAPHSRVLFFIRPTTPSVLRDETYLVEN